MAAEEAYNTIWEVKKYHLVQVTGHNANESRRAMIALLGPPGSALIAFVSFTDLDPVPPDGFHPFLGALMLNCRHDAYHPMLDMLRNERPIYVYPFGEGLHIVGTQDEPVGEGDEAMLLSEAITHLSATPA
jgi:hypothetical protein